jgi:hypothetical protein
MNIHGLGVAKHQRLVGFFSRYVVYLFSRVTEIEAWFSNLYNCDRRILNTPALEYFGNRSKSMTLSPKLLQAVSQCERTLLKVGGEVKKMIYYTLILPR